MLLFLLALVQGELFLEPLTTGSSCTDVGVVFINSYYITPYPPTKCVPQAIQMIGTFTENYCVDQILITETYNSQTFNQVVPIGKCYNKAQQVEFDFTVNTFVCSAGSYTVQTAIMSHPSPAVSLGCWQYSYTLS